MPSNKPTIPANVLQPAATYQELGFKTPQQAMQYFNKPKCSHDMTLVHTTSGGYFACSKCGYRNTL